MLIAFALVVLTGAAYAVREREHSAINRPTPGGSRNVHSSEQADAPVPGPIQRVMDEAGFLGDDEDEGLEGNLRGISLESGVDIRFIFAREITGDIESYSGKRMRELGVGRDMNRRSLLFVYDVKGKRMRAEVGPQMEGMFPDGFVGYLMREQTASLFASGNKRIALKSTLSVITHRLREAALGGTYDPKAVAYITDSRRLAAGAGATARAPYGTNVRPWGERIATDEARAHFGPQPTVADAFARYHEALHDGHYEPDLSLYTPQSQLLLRAFQIAQPFAEFILYAEHGQGYKIVERGDIAILFFTTTPFVSAHLFRRSAHGWQLDLAAEVRDTREFIGSAYTWSMILTGDDYSRTFSDLFADCGVSFAYPTTSSGRPMPPRILRPADGDNRPLPIRKGRGPGFVRKPIVRPAGESRVLLRRSGTQTEDFGYPTQTIDQLAMRRLLTSRSYDSLDAVLSAYGDSVGRDYRLEYRLFDGYDAFDIAISSLEPYLNEWVTQRPQSAPALLARAVYFGARGWDARGSEYSSRTSRAQFQEMDTFFRRSRADYNAGMRLDPRSIVPYRGLMNLLVNDEDNDAIRELLDRGLKLQPNSYRLRATYMSSLLPRWGGSYEAMTQFAKESAPYAAKNPRIRALAGFADWDRGRLLEKRGKKDAAINAYTRALESGDFWKFRYARGALYYHVRRNEEALEDLNRALTQAPEDPDALYFRSCVNYALGFNAKGDARSAYFAHAYDDIELAVALDPTDTWYQKQLAWVQKNIPEYAPPPRL